ncbi:glycosyltransferase family 4 protein [Salipiger sp.]|uniref:glycosyltransferase family 4 protein n=1 Tax=Salipiger sp. TaxID=2078585 RepID=UPI003A96FB50
MQHRPLNIAYLCDISPLDRNMYSGGNAQMYDALRRHAGSVYVISPSWSMAEPVRRMMHKFPSGLNMRLRWRLHLAMARFASATVRRELRKEKFDALFCAYSLQSLGMLRAPYPIVTAFTSDATNSVFRSSELGAMHGTRFFGQVMDPWIETRERRILQEVDLLLWPSEWIKRAAEARYGLRPEASHLVPWGANITAPAPRLVPQILPERQPVRLLLVGRAWRTKGGPLAVEVTRALRARGIDARLTVIGCCPEGYDRDDAVEIVGPLDKSLPQDAAKLARAYETAHFFLMPSHETYGFAFCEASAHGVPSLCLRVSGVPVRDGVNGYAFRPGTPAAEFADKVMGFLHNPESYHALCISTRQEYETSLNWDSWGSTVAKQLREKVNALSED